MTKIARKHWSRRNFLRMAGAASLGGIVTACAKPKPTEAPAAKATATPVSKKAGGEVSITVGGWAVDSTNELVDKFGFLDMGYTVRVEVTPGGPEITSMLVAGLASGNAPYDVLDFEDGQAIAYSRAGYLEYLDDLLPSDFWEDFPENLMAMAEVWDQYEGKTFRVHHNFEAQYHWYRKDWFDEKGIEPPTTWKELAELGKIFTDEADGVWAVEEGMLPGFLSVYLGYLCKQAGGTPFDTDDKLRTVLEFIHDLMYVDKTLNPASLQKTYDQQNADYTGDKVAYMRQWPFFHDVARAKEGWFAEEKAAIAMPPVGPGGKESSTYAAGWGYGILKGAPNPEGAKDLFKFLVSKENAGQMAVMDTWYLINRHSVMAEMGDKGMAKYLKMYSDAGVIGVRPYHPKFGEASTKIDEAATAFLTDQIDIDQAMQQAEDAMKVLQG